MVPNAIFRERFKELEEEQGLSLSEVAERCGWYTTGSKKQGQTHRPDSSRVARSLGLTPEKGKRRQHITYANAVTLCQALHIEYTAAGV